MNIEDYSKYYIQGSDHYLIPKDVFMELFNEMINWKEENKILRENAEYNGKVVDKVNWENMLLKKENEQLKDNWREESKELKEKINGVDEERTYLYNKLSAENEQLNSLVNSCQEEIRILKKQLEEKENIACNWKDNCLENAGKIEKLENQQKEFIKFLEDNYKETQDIWYIKILQKYKSIIGGASNE